MIDPLHAFTAGAFVAGTPRPCPLIATRYDVTIEAGLAIVVMRRTFRNAEAGSTIEATITFPLPGACHAVRARCLHRRAPDQDRAAPSAGTWRGAPTRMPLDRGKGAVLHRGGAARRAHAWSDTLLPDTEVEVRATWANHAHAPQWPRPAAHPRHDGQSTSSWAASVLAEQRRLHPWQPVVQRGWASTVACRDEGVASLIGGRLENGRADVPLNAPIDLDVIAWTPHALAGRMAGGRAVALRIEPIAGGERRLDVAMLVDRSGSMSEMCSALDGLTKHEAAVSALDRLAGEIGGGDIIDLWEFAAKLKHVGTTRDMPLQARSCRRPGRAGRRRHRDRPCARGRARGRARARHPAGHRRQEPCARRAGARAIGPPLLHRAGRGR